MITSLHIKNIGIIDDIIKEPKDGVQNDFDKVIKEIKKYLIKNIDELEKIPKKKLVEQRYQKFRNM